MEPNNSGYPRRGEALRNSRSPSHRNASREAQRMSEEEYELRRQQELRRQIQLRERELEMQSSNRDRFARVNSGSQAQFAEEPMNFGARNQSSRSPVRHRDQSFGSGQVNRDLLGVSQVSTVPHRQARDHSHSNSPLRLQQYLGPNREADMPRGNSSRLAPTEYLAQLRRDNESLQRRLNLVLAELDRINREKQGVQQRLGEIMLENDSLQHQLESKNEQHDNENRGVQQDLNGIKNLNSDFKQRVNVTENMATDTVSRLRVAQAERERSQANREATMSEMQRATSQVESLDRERQIINNQLHEVNHELQHLNQNDHSNATAIRDMQLDADRLRMERDDLAAKLDAINRDYDITVHEISRERETTQIRNANHQKLLVAKTSFQLLEAFVKRREQNAMNEFFNYCRFDQKCHGTLKNFVGILERIGHFRMRRGLKQWFQKCFKPLECQEQIENLIQTRYEHNLRQHMFYNWRNVYNAKTDAFNKKTNALHRIWALKCKDVKKEIIRSFVIWRDAMRYDRVRETKLKNLILYRYRRSVELAWERWLNHEREENWQIRMQLTAKTFAQDQHTQISFNQLRNACQESKRKRLQRLRTSLNAWKQYREYRKFMMGGNLAAGRFLCENRMTNLKQCFDALRNHKETEKHLLMTQALADNQLAIERTTDDLNHRQDLMDQQIASRAKDIITRMIYRQVASYFFRWKDELDGGNMRKEMNMQKLIIRMYFRKIQKAFQVWKQGEKFSLNTNQQGIILDLQDKGSVLQGHNMRLDKHINQLQKNLDKSGRIGLRRAEDIWSKRQKRHAMDKWHKLCEFRGLQEDGRDMVVGKTRRIYLRQAMKLYKQGVAFRQREEKNQARAMHFCHTRDMRSLRRSFNALCVYVHKFGKSKVYWSLLLGKMDNWMKRRAFIIWQNQGNQKVTDLLQDSQNVAQNHYEDLNTHLGELTQKHEKKVRANQALDARHKQQGRAVLATTFGRFYHVSTARAFEKWQDFCRWQKHRDFLMRKTLNQWQRYKFYMMRAAFENFAKLCIKKDTKSALDHRTMEKEEQLQMNQHQANLHASLKNQLEGDTSDMKSHADLLNNRLSEQIEQIIHRNDMNYFVDNRRYILQQWRAFVQRQKHWCNSVKHALQKSMWKKGFEHIRAFAADKKLTREQNRGCEKVRKMFWQKSCGSAFSLWRENLYYQTVDNTIQTVELTNQAIQLHADKFKKIKNQNCTRSKNIMVANHLRDIVKAWKNVTNYLRTKREANDTFNQKVQGYLVQRAISRWQARTKTAMQQRQNKYLVEQGIAKMYKRKTFEALKRNCQNNARFCKKLSGLAKRFDINNMQRAWYLIRDSNHAHDAVDIREKRQATINLQSVMKAIWRRKMTSYLSDVRNQAYQQCKEHRNLRALARHMNNRTMRDAFYKWKSQSTNDLTVIEVNEIGPVVEEVLEHRLDVCNLKDFMRKEGYNEDQVMSVSDITQRRVKGLMAGAIARMQHNSAGDPEKFVAFDRWKLWLKMRKIAKHWMAYIANRQQPVRSDLSYAFDKWKYSHGKSENTLSRQTYDYLLQRGVLAAKRLNNCAENTQQQEYLLSQLGLQRDELVENKAHAQSLSFALHNNNVKFGMHQGLMRWSDGAHHKKRLHFEGVLGRNLDQISGLKDKVHELEEDNESLACQNEEMRQISLDGYQIARNVQNLNSEREKLSVDLADKTSMIKRLLDENEKLSFRLRQAQDDVDSLRMTRAHQRNADARRIPTGH